MSFNSYMVRLEVSLLCPKKWAITVSIPIWCDWKLSSDVIISCSHKFQFLYGAIGRGLGAYCLDAETLFQFLYGAIGRRDRSSQIAEW